MTMPINTFQDILDALEQNPDLARQLRQHVLTQELLNLPAIVGQPQPGDDTIVNQLKGINSRLESLDGRVESLETSMQVVLGRTGDQEGRVYEDWAAAQIHDLLWFALGMQHAEVAYAASTRHGRQEIETLANNLPQEEQLDRAQRHHLFSTDIIVRGNLDGQVTYIAVEASITGGEDDVRRADHRRQLVERITNVPCRSALVANSLAQRLATTVPDPDVEFPTVSADLFNSLPRGESTPDPTPIRQDVLVLPLAPRE